MQKLTIEQLSTILEVSEIISTTNHAGMLIHNIVHPTHGQAVTVQGDDGAILVTK